MDLSDTPWILGEHWVSDFMDSRRARVLYAVVSTLVRSIKRHTKEKPRVSHSTVLQRARVVSAVESTLVLTIERLT